jgi:hypothetical protein
MDPRLDDHELAGDELRWRRGEEAKPFAATTVLGSRGKRCYVDSDDGI